MEIYGNPGLTFAMVPCLHQAIIKHKEGTGVVSPKMYSSRQCKNLTYLCGTANDPVSRKPV